MSTNTLTALEKSPRNAYIRASTRIPDMSRSPDVIETKAQVDAVVDAFFLTGDQSVFTRHIRAMTNDDFASSFAIMRGSGNELDPMGEFLSIVLDGKIISDDDVVAYNLRFSDWKKSKAA
jgi:hypothetical protein